MKNVKGRSKNYEFKYSLILLFLFRSLSSLSMSFCQVSSVT